MNILRFPLGQLQANCYLLIQDKECIIIDPADEASFILEEIQRRNLQLIGIIATHGHFDHVMAAGEIQLSYPEIPLHVHSSDLVLINRLGETAKYFLGFDPQVIEPQKIFDLKAGVMSIGFFTFKVIETPGHTPGSCCVYFKKEKALFTGDTIFKDSIGRYDFSYSDKSVLKKSIETVLSLSESTIIYSGHGEETTVDAEKKNFIHYF